MGIETKIKSLGVPQTKILEIFIFDWRPFWKMAKTGSQSQFFFWQHREYHSWESTEENYTTHGGSWGGGVHGTPVGLWTILQVVKICIFKENVSGYGWLRLRLHWLEISQVSTGPHHLEEVEESHSLDSACYGSILTMKPTQKHKYGE